MSQCSTRQLFWTEDFKLPLPVHWFDGILNAGRYHASSTNIWKNLGSASSNFDAQRNRDSASTTNLWVENAAVFTSNTNIYQPFFVGDGSDSAFRLLGEEGYTIGCTFAVEQGWRTNYSGILGSHNSWNNNRNVGLAFGKYENGVFSVCLLNTNQHQVFSSGTLSCLRRINANEIPSNIATNVIISMSSNRRALFLNGELHSEFTNTISPSLFVPNGNAFTLGSCLKYSSSDYNVDRTFVGKIFDVYVWDKEMTDKEIKSISNYSLNRFKQ